MIRRVLLLVRLCGILLLLIGEMGNAWWAMGCEDVLCGACAVLCGAMRCAG